MLRECSEKFAKSGVIDMFDFLIVLQARSGSTRLPRKAFYRLSTNGEWLVKRCLIRLSRLREELEKLKKRAKLVLAVPENDEFLDKFKRAAYELGVELLMGSEEHVLSRFWKALENWSSCYVVRATADNAFVDVKAAIELCEEIEKREVDYCALKNEPLGVGVEVVKADALLSLKNEKLNEKEIEHVTYAIHNTRKKRFKIEKMDFSKVYPALKIQNVRLTLDTLFDWIFQNFLAKEIEVKFRNWKMFDFDHLDEILESKRELLVLEKVASLYAAGKVAIEIGSSIDLIKFLDIEKFSG